MSELINAKTGTPEDVPDHLVDQAVAAGSHSFPKGTQVSLKAPDGGYSQIPAENLHYALSKGYKVFTPTQQAVDQAVSDNDNVAGSLKVAGSQFIDQLGFGVPELIYKKTQDPLAVAKYEAIKKDHELANDAGNVLGFGTSLFTGAPLFKGAGKLGQIAEKGIAARLGVEAAENMGTRTINSAAADIAKNLIAKTAGGAVEGAALFMPQAATEAVLGDPDQAGEMLLSGVGIGGLLGAGGMAAKGLLNIGKGALEKGAKLAGEAPITGQKIAQTGAELLTGVKGDMIPEYVQNAERINAAPAKEELRNTLDNHVFDYKNQLELAQKQADDALAKTNEAYRFKVQDLKKEMVPEPIRNDLLTDLNAQKARLGEMSEQADDLLSSSGVEFKKQQLLNVLNDLSESVGAGKTKALIGDEATAAVNKLKTTADRISETLPDTIDAQTMRDVLKQVRSDIKWNDISGQTSDTLNKLRTNFQKKISDALKTEVPGYADMMSHMSGMSQNLEKASNLFGTPERADSLLTNIFKPANRIARDTLTQFETLSGTKYFDRLQGLAQSRQLLEEAAVKGIPEKLVPEFHAQAQDAQQRLASLQEKYGDIVRRFNPSRVKSIVENSAIDKASGQEKELFQKFQDLTGNDFKQQIRDRNILDSFGKKSIQGSRKAMAGYAVGSAVAGPVGGAIGAGLGLAGDVYSGKVLKYMLDKRPDISGLLFVEKQMKSAAEKLDAIPSILDRMSAKTFATSRQIGTDIVGQLLNSRRDVKNNYKASNDKHENMQELRKAMAELGTNPALFQQKLANLTSGISQYGAPNIGQAFNAKTGVAFNYIFQALPKPPNPTSPFAKQVTFKPSDQEISNFMQKLQVVQDPFSVLDDLRSGTLTKNHMDALKTVYPRIHNLIQQKVQMHVMDGNAKPMPYQSRLKLSLLMETPMDSSMKPQAIMAYQHSYQMPDQTVDKMHGPNVSFSKDTMTETQKLEQKG